MIRMISRVRLSPRRRQGLFALALLAAGNLSAATALAAGEDDAVFGRLLVDRLEHRWNDGRDSLVWEADGWLGTDYDKLWVKTQGERLTDGTVEQAEAQMLYSRYVDDFWDVQVGLRHDFRPRPSRNYGVVGLQGLAPQWFEIDAAAFVSEKGDLSARLQAEYDLLLTQRLVLQVSAESEIAATEVRELGVGSGINDIGLGVRLRYEFRREFAPYIGLSWERKLGATADLARAENEDIDNFALLAGVRFWF